MESAFFVAVLLSFHLNYIFLLAELRCMQFLYFLSRLFYQELLFHFTPRYNTFLNTLYYN